MLRSRAHRRADDVRAARVLTEHLNPIMAIVGESIADVDPGQHELGACVRDARLVVDIAIRLDVAIPMPEPIETWDVLLWSLVAGLALAIYRSAKSAPRRTEQRLAARVLARALHRAGHGLGPVPDDGAEEDLIAPTR